VSQNHPFIDGNKRTAFGAAYAFLSINGIRLTAGESAIVRFVSSLYERGGLQFANLDAWLRKNTEPA
jgi:death-on-curing protein